MGVSVGMGAATAARDMAVAARFLVGLPPFLRRPLRSAEAHAILRQRLARREQDFLDLARTLIFAQPGSPYRALLDLAGCGYGDLEGLVRREGLEGALAALVRAGVYLSVEESKGRRPVVRGSATLHLEPTALRNPRAVLYATAASGGSRGPRTEVPIDLASVRDNAVNQLLSLEARGGLVWQHAYYGVPGGSAIRVILRHSAFGAHPVRWFSPVDPAAPGLHPRYLWSARVMRWAGWLAGVRLPAPRHVAADDPLPVARWMRATLDAGATPHLRVAASTAVRLCRSAERAGFDLAGAQLTLNGEPLTGPRADLVRRAGAHGVPSYAAMETGGPLAYGCLAPRETDDMHLFDDLHAAIEPPDGDGTLLVTSLRPTAPILLLNASVGDLAVLERRACGCPLEGMGWATHLHSVRSREKLTAAGMTFLDVDVARVLEETLPAQFGGGPTDYQLVEDTSAQTGRPRLTLVVDPCVGPLDEAAVRAAFLAAVGQGAGAERVMSLAWSAADLLTVERRPPARTASGKVLHLHAARPPDGQAAG